MTSKLAPCFAVSPGKVPQISTTQSFEHLVFLFPIVNEHMDIQSNSSGTYIVSGDNLECPSRGHMADVRLLEMSRGLIN